MKVSQECVLLCHCDLETCNQMFFQCRVAKAIIVAVAEFLKSRDMPCNWQLLILWFNGLRKRTLRTKVVSIGITMALSEVWRMRNAKI